MNKKYQQLYISLLWPTIFVIIIWLMKIIEYVFEIDLSFLGIYPLRWQSLPCIVTHPLVHGDFEHLIANTAPAFLLLTGLFFFYRKIAFSVFLFIYLTEGFWLWFLGRESYHIGASGLIYGLTAFLFFSGVFRKNKSLTAISLLVAFLYGGIVWGLFPSDEKISWEGHLMGFIAGTAIALYYIRIEQKNNLLKKMDASTFECDLDGDYSAVDNSGGFEKIKYHYSSHTNNKT